jgi:hypothetical protein
MVIAVVIICEHRFTGDLTKTYVAKLRLEFIWSLALQAADIMRTILHLSMDYHELSFL